MGKFEANALLGAISLSIGGWLSKMGVLGYLLIIFTVTMILDYISGVIASKKEAIEHPNSDEYGWSSKKGVLGIIKKFGYIMIVFATMLVDYTIYKMAGCFNIDMPFATFFSTIIVVWFILNEILSIIENTGRMGVTNIPKFLTRVVCALKNTVEKEAEQVVDHLEKESAEHEQD